VKPIIENGDKGAPVLVLAHGAGAGMDSDFMNQAAEGLADNGIYVVRFEFSYMQIQRETGKRRPPDRQSKLLEHFAETIDELGLDNPVIGGKSMGGRMATLLAAQRPFAGVVVLGYPFHAIGKPEKVRTDHFDRLKAHVLICQGERDSMGSYEEVQQYRVPETVGIEWLTDGDHDLKPRKSSGHSHQAHLTTVIEKVSQFIHEVTAEKACSTV
jgi:uncharacterized protein